MSQLGNITSQICLTLETPQRLHQSSANGSPNEIVPDKYKCKRLSQYQQKRSGYICTVALHLEISD